MKFFLGALILIVNIYATSRGISSIFIACILGIIFATYYAISKKSENGIVIVLIELMCYTWSSSWRNISGGDFGNIPIPWFYMIGLIVCIYILFKYNLKFLRSQITILLIYIFLIITGFIPVIISNNLKEALSDYLTYLFFFIITFVFNFAKIKFTKIEYINILKAFVNACFITSIGIIIEAVIQKTVGINIISNVQTQITGGNRIGSALLFQDTSSAMICLGAAVMIIIANPNIMRFRYLIMLSIISGMGITSTRTGLVALLITFFIYIVFQENVKNKVKLLISLPVIGMTGLFVLSMVRNINNVSDLLNPAGRIEGYIMGLKIWADNPVLGIGFGDTYLVSLMNYIPIPHLTLLNLLVQGGIVFVLPFMLLIYYYFRLAQKCKMKTEVYTITVSLIGSFFIPTLFSARFFTLVIIMVCMRKNIHEQFDY